MLAIRSSIYLTYTSQSIQFSTLTGSTLIVQSTLTASAITVNATSTNTVTFSTLTGSTINASSLTATTGTYSTLTYSTANISTILPSTIGVGNTFLITSNGTTGTNDTTPQYQLDVTGSARAAVLQFQDDSVSITKQAPLDYSTFGQAWTQSITPYAMWSSIGISANGQIQVAVVNGGGIWYSSSYGKSWLQSATAGTTALMWSSVAVSANGTFASATVNGGGIWYSSNSGQTWTSAATTLAWSSIAVSASGQYQVACVNGASIWYSSNYGQTWTTANTSSLAWSAITISASGQYACATVNGVSIWYSSNYGLSWISSGVASSAWSAITMSASGQNVSATVNGGSIWYSTTYGQTWTSSGVASSAWNRICMVSSGQYQLAASIASAPVAAMYTFSTFTFTPCGATGRLGPTSLTYNTTTFPWATSPNLTVSSGIQRWTVPVTGYYQLTAAGAGGGTSFSGITGTRGVIVSNTVLLLQGQILYIVVGQKGVNGISSSTSGGGGGGTFIVKYLGGTITSANSYQILLIAGGGGGGGRVSTFGTDALTTTTASPGNGVTAASGGNGGGGHIGSTNEYRPGGGGFLTNGLQSSPVGGQPNQDASGYSGLSFLNGGLGGNGNTNVSYYSLFASFGGFGGGGAGGINQDWGGGGGGGYSGGVSAGYPGESGSGGGSYDINGTNNAATLNTSLGTAGYNPAATDGYVTISYAQIYSSSNYGASWTPITQQFGPAAIAVSSTGQYSSMCVNTGAIYTSITAGPSLATSGALTVTEPFTTASLTYVDGSTDVTGQPPLDYTTFGQNWSITNASVTSGAIGSGISASGQYQIQVSISGGSNATSGIYYSSTYGQTWTQSASTSAIAWIACAISESGKFAIATASSTAIYISSNYGQTWSATSQTSSGQTRCAISATGQYMVAGGGIAGSATPIYLSADYGQTWSSISGTTQTWTCVAISASGQYIFGGTNNVGVYYSSNYGQTWALSGPTISTMYITCSASGQYVCATDSNGSGIYYSSTYGTSWKNAVSPITIMYGIAMSASGQYVVAGGGSVDTQLLYYSTTYGQTWIQVPSSPQGNWYSISMSPSGHYLLAGAIGGSFYQSVTRYPTVYATNAIVSFPSSYFTVATTGFTTLPGGMIAQWGFYTIPSQGGLYAGPYTVTFPKAFPSAVISVNVTMSDVGVGGNVSQYAPLAYGPVTTGFDLYTKSIPNAVVLSSSAVTVYWHAYGY